MAYETYEAPDDVQKRALELFDIARSTGKIKKGANEATKAVERGTAKLVIIAKDVTPPEIVMHLPALCDEKAIPYVFIKSKKQVGEASGIKIGCSASVILESGEGKNNLKKLKEDIAKIRGK